MGTYRFIPDHCPGCQGRVDPKYSQYRHAPTHLLFLPLLIAGIVFLIGFAAYSFYRTAWDVIELVDGLGLRRSERGLLFFLLCAASLPLLVWVARKWWRLVHRLPRRFSFECPSCHWTGTVKVMDLSAMFDVTSGAQVRLEMDGMETGPDLIDAKRERLEQRKQRERRQTRELEHESPPNPELDFQ